MFNRGGWAAPSASPPPQPYSVSKEEAASYYVGLPSRPRLVFRTGTGPPCMVSDCHLVKRELRPVFGHKLNTVWKELGPKVCDCIDSLRVLWTTVDVVRFIWDIEDATVGPVVLWIGVAPETLSGEDAHIAAHSCLDLLKEYDITDVEVEFRESIYTRSAGPSLLKANPVSESDPTVNIRRPLTPALGLSIASLDTTHIEGTGGLFLAEGGDSNKLLLLTARHTLFPPSEGPNVNYVCTNTSMPRHYVLLLCRRTFDNFRESIKSKMEGYSFRVNSYNKRIEKLQKSEAGEHEDIVKKATEERKEVQELLDKENEALLILEKFHEDVNNNWGQSKRVFGYIVRSPPLTLGAGPEGFTEDYAIVELDRSRFEQAFMGNMIDLRSFSFSSDTYCGLRFYPGTDVAFELVRKLHLRTDAWRFEHLDEHFLKLQGVIEEDQMHNPDILDSKGEPCLPVVKNGSATGVTVGRANGIFSLVREYYNNGTHRTSTEWAILPYGTGKSPFSDPGDSGSIIADGRGRIGGLLTGRAGGVDISDITYATPFFWLLRRIRENGFPDAHIYPVMD